MTQNFTNFQDLSADDKNVCRACMSKENVMICVFNNKKLKMCEMLEFCTGVRISRNDILPKQICKRCLIKLEIAYKFKKDCLQTEEVLHAAFEIYKLKAQEIKEENVETVVESLETYINLKKDVNDLKKEIIKEEILTTKEENDHNYAGDVTVCISDNNNDFMDLDYDPVGSIMNFSSKSCAKECKNTNQLIARIPPGVSVKIINHSKTPKENTEQKIIGNNMETDGMATATTSVSVEKVGKKRNISNISVDQSNVDVDVNSKEYVKKTLEEKLLTSDGILFEQNPGELLKKDYLNATERRLSQCDIQFKTSQQIKEHKRDSHSFVATICAICGALPASRQAQQRHMKTHEVPSHKCEFCDYVTYFARDLDKHLHVHKDIKEYVCEYCTRSFRNLSNLKVHIRLHHGSFNKKHACSRCSYRTYYKGKLIRHMDSHDNIKRYECEICNSRYARREQWKKHVETVHNIHIPRLRPGRQKILTDEYNLNNILQAYSLSSDVNLKGKQDKNVSSDVSLKNVQEKCGVSLARVDKVNESDETAV